MTNHVANRVGTNHVGVFIVGAGPAGLTAGCCLSRHDPSVLIIEKDPVYVGGISRTVRYKDFLFDVGGHRFFSKSKEVVDLWREILPDDFIERPRLSRIFYGGKFYSYPLSAGQALANLGLVTSAACMLSYAYAKLRPIKDPRTFHEWVRNQFGERLFSIFFKTYTEKVWGMSCDEISADWAAQRIKGLDLGVAVIVGRGGLGGRLAQGHDQPPDVGRREVEALRGAVVEHADELVLGRQRGHRREQLAGEPPVAAPVGPGGGVDTDPHPPNGWPGPGPGPVSPAAAPRGTRNRC